GGTTGQAGSGPGGGGTTGGAGTTGSAGRGGTTGSAGRGGTTGTAGTSGTAGTTGRGGTTGAAGTTGSAGRGGTTGSAGRGGTTGSAGTSGSAGRGGQGGQNDGGLSCSELVHAGRRRPVPATGRHGPRLPPVSGARHRYEGPRRDSRDVEQGRLHTTHLLSRHHLRRPRPGHVHAQRRQRFRRHLHDAIRRDRPGLTAGGLSWTADARSDGPPRPVCCERSVSVDGRCGGGLRGGRTVGAAAARRRRVERDAAGGGAFRPAAHAGRPGDRGVLQRRASVRRGAGDVDRRPVARGQGESDRRHRGARRGHAQARAARRRSVAHPRRRARGRHRD